MLDSEQTPDDTSKSTDSPKSSYTLSISNSITNTNTNLNANSTSKSIFPSQNRICWGYLQYKQKKITDNANSVPNMVNHSDSNTMHKTSNNDNNNNRNSNDNSNTNRNSNHNNSNNKCNSNNFKSMYFVLSNNFLFGANGPNSTRLSIVISLEGTEILEIKENDRYIFCIKTKHVCYEFTTPVYEATKQWVHHIIKGSKLRVTNVYKFLGLLGRSLSGIEIVSAIHRKTKTKVAITAINKKTVKNISQLASQIHQMKHLYDIYESECNVYLIVKLINCDCLFKMENTYASYKNNVHRNMYKIGGHRTRHNKCTHHKHRHTTPVHGLARNTNTTHTDIRTNNHNYNKDNSNQNENENENKTIPTTVPHATGKKNNVMDIQR